WLRDERPDLPDRFVQTVERALQFDPDLRYESAGAMEAALARLGSIPDSPGAGRGEAAVAATPVATPPSRRHAPRVAVVSSLAIAVGFVAAAVLLPSATRDRIFGRFGRPGQRATAGGFPADCNGSQGAAESQLCWHSIPRRHAVLDDGRQWQRRCRRLADR